MAELLIATNLGTPNPSGQYLVVAGSGGEVAAGEAAGRFIVVMGDAPGSAQQQHHYDENPAMVDESHQHCPPIARRGRN